MGKDAARQIEARRRARQRQQENEGRAQEKAIRGAVGPPSAEQLREAALREVGPRRRAALTCGWCKGPIELKVRGRIPKWCSAACRQRAWEQARAARSGLAAVEVVERVIPVAGAPTALARPRHGDWPPLLAELAWQLDTGQLYERDLLPVAQALSDLLEAVERRTTRPR